jgi:putrescine transport system substrate-binding protein
VAAGIGRAAARTAIIAFASALCLAACGRHQPGPGPAADVTAAAVAPLAPTSEQKVLNIYNWFDYIDPSVISGFEKEYGLKVNYDVYDTNDVLETKLLAGRTGYDIVVPSAPFLQRQIQAGVYQKLDKALLPNLGNLDASLNRAVAVNDPGNQYGVIYLWGTLGVGYNVQQINAAMPDAPIASAALLYDPAVVRHFKDCGVLILDQPQEVVASVLAYLGKDPGSESLDDLKAAEQVLLSIRPYLRYIDSSKGIDGLANGEICLALSYNGDIGQVRSRSKEAGRSAEFGYDLPAEGALMWFDMLAIPADAPHPRNAHLFIDYLLRPEVAARNSSAVHYANSNAASYKLVDPAVYDDSSIYVSEEMRARLHPIQSHGLSYTRELNRTWSRFKSAR